MNKSKTKRRKAIPRYGFIARLAEECNCSRNTVSAALYKGTQGEKSDLVRKKYKAKYGSL